MYINRDKPLVNPVQTLGKKQTKLTYASLEYRYLNAGKSQTVTEYKMNKVPLRLVAVRQA